MNHYPSTHSGQATRRKALGIHYTPPELAGFLARVAVRHLPARAAHLAILDPACGGGALLQALWEALPEGLRRRARLFGFESDPQAIVATRALLADCHGAQVHWEARDFLAPPPDPSAPTERFDLIIANPPYVRTQVLGARRAGQLARRFGLAGRVDLYQAFIQAMAAALRPGGILALLTSNRFLTVQSGAAVRRLLSTQFSLEEIYDLGDTRLFQAAVLPAVLVARKESPPRPGVCTFDRIYACRGRGASAAGQPFPTVVDALLDRRVEGTIATAKGTYHIDRGTLAAPEGDGVWSLSTPQAARWLATVHAHQAHTFGDLGVVRVGIKTTADGVFIRDDWETLPAAARPEPTLLRPLLTHEIAARWRARGVPHSRVLYPHESRGGKRAAVALDEHPRAARYLAAHRRRLEGRKYLIAAGRQWYEIWVAHHPEAWAAPKIVFPDIAEQARFFRDTTGAVVNGDCYWITLREGVEPAWLLLMLAVANASFMARYYDLVFHNKLYAGRRRFMTQYVKRFPLPALETAIGRQIVSLSAALIEEPSDAEKEARLDELVWRAFGVTAEESAG